MSEFEGFSLTGVHSPKKFSFIVPMMVVSHVRTGGVNDECCVFSIRIWCLFLQFIRLVHVPCADHGWLFACHAQIYVFSKRSSVALLTAGKHNNNRLLRPAPVPMRLNIFPKTSNDSATCSSDLIGIENEIAPKFSCKTLKPNSGCLKAGKSVFINLGALKLNDARQIERTKRYKKPSVHVDRPISHRPA